MDCRFLSAPATLGLVIGLLATCGNSRPAQAQLFTPRETAWLVSRLNEERTTGTPTAAGSARTAREVMGKYAAVVEGRERLDLNAFAIPSYDTVACVLDRAVERGVSVAQLFADDIFLADGPVAIAIGADTLRDIDAHFDLHSLFPLAVMDTGHHPLRMLFFAAGRGRLLIGYDRTATASPPDGAYHIFSGRYEYQPFIRMDSARDGTGKRLSHIATLSSPTAALSPFVGPANAAIVGMDILGRTGVVKAKLAFTVSRTLALPAVERKPLPAGQLPARRAACPLLNAPPRGG